MPTRRLILAAPVLVLAAWSCAPQCETISPSPQSVCHRADAGAIAPGVPFVLEGTTFVRNGTCVVSIDGGQIDLAIEGVSCASTNTGAAFTPTAPSQVPCQIPALDAGAYRVTSITPVSFTIPESADAGVPSCL
jgi:hypothetical protein